MKTESDFQPSRLDNIAVARCFISVVVISLLLLLYFVIHLGYFFDIPYVPTFLVFRIPAFAFVTCLYIYVYQTLRNMEIAQKLFHDHL